jgi:tRNA threonylcarbamoyladenosine biosynthesis protein TsaB
MRVLGIDTATAVASVALVEDGKLVAEEIQSNRENLSARTGALPRGNHAEIVISLIQSVLTKAATSNADLSGIAVSIGPGSFTGVRIGLATAKGIAYEGGLPIVGVSTLQANAARVTDFEGIICSLLDARKSEVYFALFSREAHQIKRITIDAVTSLDALLDQIRNCEGGAGASLLFVGDGARVYEKLFRKSFGEAAQIADDGEYCSIASQVSRLAEGRFHAHMTDDIARLVPVYLRPSAAETKRNEYAVTR